MKVLTILVILTTLMLGSGCANTIIEPLCLPAPPALYPISIEEQIEVPPSILIKVGTNDKRLKSWIKTTTRITDEHNKQFKAKCYEEDL